MDSGLPTVETCTESALPEYEAPPGFTPRIIVLISGKRKSGKDYLLGLLQNRLKEMRFGENIGTLRMANPVKYQWAALHGAEYEKMLDSGTYKELHRPGMAKVCVDVRARSIGYYPREAILMDGAIGKSIWICPDMRHTQDIDWFSKYYSGIVKKIRVEATEEVRRSRGFVYTTEIDTGPTECELDHITDWDLVVVNNGEHDEVGLECGLARILDWIQTAMNQHSRVE